MNPTTGAVDLAKNDFDPAVDGDSWRMGKRHRLTRSPFERISCEP